jgi:hypothetical protein
MSIHHLLRILFIEDRKVRTKADGGGVLTQKAIPDRMKGAAPDAARVDGDEILDATQHFARRFVRECEQEDVRGVDSVFDEPGDAISERPRFAAPGAGDDEHRAVPRHHDFELLLIELVLVADAVGRRAYGLFELVPPDVRHAR